MCSWLVFVRLLKTIIRSIGKSVKFMYISSWCKNLLWWLSIIWSDESIKFLTIKVFHKVHKCAYENLLSFMRHETWCRTRRAKFAVATLFLLYLIPNDFEVKTLYKTVTLDYPGLNWCLCLINFSIIRFFRMIVGCFHYIKSKTQLE